MTENDAEESSVYQKVIMNFQNYTRMMKKHVFKQKREIDHLPEKHQKLLTKRKLALENIEMLIYHNQQVINQIIESAADSDLGYPTETNPDVIKVYG